MPSQPACFHRLEEVLGALRSMTSTHLDLAAVEKLFRVRQRRARQIMAGLEGLRVGNAAAVSREALIARLERPPAAGVFQWEGNRRARVVEALDLARQPAGGVACAHSGCGGCVRTPPWGSFRRHCVAAGKTPETLGAGPKGEITKIGPGLEANLKTHRSKR